MIAIVFAIAAILTNAPPAEFTEAVLRDCTPHVEWQVFVGCETTGPTEDEGAYAGLIWVDGNPTLQTGP